MHPRFCLNHQHDATLTSIFHYVELNQSLFDIQGYVRHNCTFRWYTVTLRENHRSNTFVQLDKTRQFPWQTHGFKQPEWLTQFILANWASEKHWKKKKSSQSAPLALIFVFWHVSNAVRAKENVREETTD